MAAQLNYNYSTPSGVPGGKADISYDEAVTRMNEAENGAMKFGMGVVVGTNAGTGVKVPASTDAATAFEGITLHAENTEHDMSGKVIVKKGATLSVMTKGHVWARLGAEVTPVYGNAAYLIKDGDDAGCFTTQSSSYSRYEKVESTASGAKEVVADDTASPTSSQIKVGAVTPVAPGYTPAVGDYVASKQLHGATLDVGAKFGNFADTDNGIAVVQL